MEKTKNNNTSTSRLVLENQKKIMVTGVAEILSSNESSLFAKLNKGNIYIYGSGIHITKLDVEQGLLEAEGNFNQIKYNDKSDNIFKRIFRWI